MWDAASDKMFANMAFQYIHSNRLYDIDWYAYSFYPPQRLLDI